MAVLAESLVDEWLNRQGFFTVRGLKDGVDEIDLLGVRPAPSGLEAWHVEVQASFRPIGYIARLPKAAKDFAKSRTSIKQRPHTLVEEAVAEWIEKKFTARSKKAARDAAWPGLSWRYVLSMPSFVNRKNWNSLRAMELKLPLSIACSRNSATEWRPGFEAEQVPIFPK